MLASSRVAGIDCRNVVISVCFGLYDIIRKEVTPGKGGGPHSHIFRKYMRTNIRSTLKLRPTNHKHVLVIKAKIYIRLYSINKLGCLQMDHLREVL